MRDDLSERRLGIVEMGYSISVGETLFRNRFSGVDIIPVRGASVWGKNLYCYNGNMFNLYTAAAWFSSQWWSVKWSYSGRSEDNGNNDSALNLIFCSLDPLGIIWLSMSATSSPTPAVFTSSVHFCQIKASEVSRLLSLQWPQICLFRPLNNYGVWKEKNI